MTVKDSNLPFRFLFRHKYPFLSTTYEEVSEGMQKHSVNCNPTNIADRSAREDQTSPYKCIHRWTFFAFLLTDLYLCEYGVPHEMKHADEIM